MKKVFIDWPTFSRNSNGIACLYDLGLSLYRAGFNVYGIPRNFRSFLSSLHELPAEYRSLPVTAKPFGSELDYFIVAETISSKTIHRARVQGIQIVWWCLAPFRLLDGSLMPELGDLSCPYSSYVDPSVDRYFYHQPEFDIHFKRAHAGQMNKNYNQSRRICVYNGKGRLRDLPADILSLCKQSEIIPIKRNLPPTRSQLFNLLVNVDCMISFDEFSALNLEAAALGIPVFLANPLFPSVCRQLFAITCLKDRVVADESDLLRLIVDRQKNCLSPWPLEYLYSANNATLSLWIELLNDSEKFKAERVNPNSILRFKNYSKYLKNKNIISIHNAGQAGSSWLTSWYISSLSSGIIGRPLLLAIAILDVIYIYFWPALLFVERLPLVRNLITKKRQNKHTYSFIQGSKIFDIK